MTHDLMDHAPQCDTGHPHPQERRHEQSQGPPLADAQGQRATPRPLGAPLPASRLGRRQDDARQAMTQSHVDTHVVTPCSYALVTRVGYALVTHVITHWLCVEVTRWLRLKVSPCGLSCGLPCRSLPCRSCLLNQGANRHPLLRHPPT